MQPHKSSEVEARCVDTMNPNRHFTLSFLDECRHSSDESAQTHAGFTTSQKLADQVFSSRTMFSYRLSVLESPGRSLLQSVPGLRVRKKCSKLFDIKLVERVRSTSDSC